MGLGEKTASPLRIPIGGAVISEDLAYNRRLRMCSLSPQNLKLYTCWIVKCPANQGEQVHTARTSDGAWCGRKRCWGFHTEIGNHLNVDPSTVCRTCHIFQQTGAVSKRMYPRGRTFRKLTKPLELYVFHLVLSHPGIYLRELTANLLATTGVEVAESTICQFLRRVGFTRQKMKLVAKQADESSRHIFLAMCPCLNLI